MIELATPSLCRGSGRQVRRVILLSGEAPPLDWKLAFARALRPVTVESAVDPALAYLSENTATARAIRRALDRRLKSLLDGEEPSVVWAHNPGLGRNILLTQALVAAVGNCPGCRLVMHHHDWWFDNRWRRWAEMRRSGFNLARIARVMFSARAHVRHIAINRADAGMLKRHLGRQALWQPNPAQPRRGVMAPRGSDSSHLVATLARRGPIWLLPCRLLRRKNIAEALLLTRWLRPEAQLVTTAGVSSEEEKEYAEALRREAQTRGWPLRLAVLEGRANSSALLQDLVERAEVLLLTSLQEGFGLPILEAAAAGRPLLARRLPNVMPDLAFLGLDLPHLYEEIQVPRSLFNSVSETARQTRAFRLWLRDIPAGLRQLAAPPPFLAQPGATVPFSRLTLTAQLEVLSQPPERSWAASLPHNPWLKRWRAAAAKGKLRPCRLERKTEAALAPDTLAPKFWSLVNAAAVSSAADPAKTLRDFARMKLASDNLYPLTWSPES